MQYGRESESERDRQHEQHIQCSHWSLLLRAMLCSALVYTPFYFPMPFISWIRSTYIYVPGGFVFVVVLKFWWKRKNAFKEMFVSPLCAHSVWKSQTGFDENKMKMNMFKEIRLSIYATNRVGKCSRSLELCKAHTTQLNSTQLNSQWIEFNWTAIAIAHHGDVCELCVFINCT